MDPLKDKRTPTPWQLIYGNLCGCRPSAVHDLDDCEPICSPIRKEDAAFICRAVNAHEELLASLKAMSRAFLTISENIPKHTQIGMAEALEIEIAKVNADKAIAKAEGR